MVCKNCGAKIKGNPHKCPLCDTKFSENEEQERKIKRGVGLYKNPFTPIYIFTVLAVVVALLFAARYLENGHSSWIAFLFSALLVYFLICHTILGMRNYISKISYFSHAVCIYLIIIFETTNSRMGYNYVYVAVQAVFFVLSVILLVCQFKVFKPYITSFIPQTLFSYVPLIVTAVTKMNYIAPLVIASLETLFTIALIIKYPREIVNQIKRFFVS